MKHGNCSSNERDNGVFPNRVFIRSSFGYLTYTWPQCNCPIGCWLISYSWFENNCSPFATFLTFPLLLKTSRLSWELFFFVKEHFIFQKLSYENMIQQAVVHVTSLLVSENSPNKDRRRSANLIPSNTNIFRTMGTFWVKLYEQRPLKRNKASLDFAPYVLYRWQIYYTMLFSI